MGDGWVGETAIVTTKGQNLPQRIEIQSHLIHGRCPSLLSVRFCHHTARIHCFEQSVPVRLPSNVSCYMRRKCTENAKTIELNLNSDRQITLVIHSLCSTISVFRNKELSQEIMFDIRLGPLRQHCVEHIISKLTERNKAPD